MGPDDFDSSELANLLDELADDTWIVEDTLSSSPFETTQLVRRRGGFADARFVRKSFSRESGMGAAYERLYEAQVMGKRFAHVPFMYDFSSTDREISVITEYVQGTTLREAVLSGRLDHDGRVAACLDLCDAITELHECPPAPVIHRDLKPSNIMLANDGDGSRLVLIDFGIARTWRPDSQRDTVRLGTPGYAPPEQYGYGQTTVQSDVYAAGMVMAFCFLGFDPTPTIRESGFDCPHIPTPMRPVLKTATAIDPAQRYGSARDLKAAIIQALFQSTDESAAGCANDPDGSCAVSAGSSSDAASYGPQVQSSAAESANFPTAGGPSGSAESPRGFWAKLVHSRVLGIVGRIWDVVLIVVWLFFTGICLVPTFNGGTEFLDRLPVWLRFIEYLTLVILPVGIVGYLLADKRPLRARSAFFAKLSWKRELPIGLGMIVVLYVIGIVAYNVFAV